MKVFAESQSTKQMTCYTSYPYANTWQVVPDPGPCYVGMLQSSIPFNCMIGGNVGQSGTDGTVVGKYVGGTLIAASSDQPTKYQWGCYDTYIGTGAASTSDGAANTAAIVGKSCLNYPYKAASLCTGLGPEWFLPANDQLQVLYNNRNAIGGFSGIMYWSSTEDMAYGVEFAWGLYFSGGYLTPDRKNYDYNVRCVRSF